MNLTAILKDSPYKLTQFHKEEIDALEQAVFLKQTAKGNLYYIKCLVRGKDIQVKPEEIVRQLYLKVLTARYDYPLNRIAVEYEVTFGREKKKADIVIFDKDRPTVPYIIIELKKPKLKDGKDQLKSYCNATGAPIGVWTNGEQISYYQRKDPNYFEDITDIPKVYQTLADILNEKFTLENLIKKDKLFNEKKSLKSLIEEMEDEVLANAGVDVFEEVFKLIFTKLYDEWLSGQGNNRSTRLLEFRNTGQTESALKNKIQKLFDQAKKKWEGVFKEEIKIALTPSHLSVCVSSLENVKLFNSNLEVVDEAFEYLINQSSKGEKGQYFTPRYIIDMCVKMLNPKQDEYMIDTAAGSSGFPVHTIFHVWKQILEDKGLEVSNLFTLEQKPYECEKYVQEKVFAIDFDKKAVRVARTLNLIAGDGQTNVLHLNTLDYERWDEVATQTEWQDIYFEGLKRLKKLRKQKDSYKEFLFDVLMANPPFAGDIKETRIIAKYDLAKKPDGKWQSKVGRDILFIERNLEFLKPGGRMAIVLPQGRVNNSSDKSIRDYIAERCRILAVVGLHGNTFKPHTGTKTSVLFVQKWNDDPKAGALCPFMDDYNIFFATMRKSGKDNSGDKIYRRVELQSEHESSQENTDWEFLQDQHGHLVIDQDLYNYEGLTEDGIAEAFIEFAKKEELSFFNLSPSVTPFDAEKYRVLMDGLEAVELKISDIINENDSFRFDSEYFRKISFELSKALNKFKIFNLSEISKVTDGDHSKFPDNQLQEIRYLRSKDIKSYFLEDNDLVYISKSYFLQNKRSHIKGENILISIMGNIGDITITPKNFEPCLSNRALAIIQDIKIIDPYFLFAYLITEKASLLINRLKNGGVQERINLDVLGKLKVPLIDEFLQKQVRKIVIYGYKIRAQSLLIYKQAEELLLLELGLKDWKPTEENISEKSFSSSFLASGRLDAEYYQPKYDELKNILSDFQQLKIQEIINYAVSSGATPKAGGDDYTDAENGIPFIRAVDLKDGRVDTSDFIYIKKYVHNSILKKTQVKKDDVLFSIAGTVGRCAIFDHEFEANINQAVSIIRFEERQIKKLYLIVFFNSIIGKFYVSKYARHGVQTNLNLTEVSNLQIPILKEKIQETISYKVQESFNLKEKSKQLLEIAKIGVEKAIETNKEMAIAWMKEQLKILEIEI